MNRTGESKSNVKHYKRFLNGYTKTGNMKKYMEK